MRVSPTDDSGGLPPGIGLYAQSTPPPPVSRLTQTAHETFESHGSAVTSRQHSAQIWFALREQHGKAIGIVEHCSGLN